MALDFPASPINGQAYGSYIYNSTIGVWQSKEDPATVAVTSTIAPASANNGDIWYNTNTGVSYVYYNDGTSAQWVEIVSSAVPALNSKANLAGGNALTGAQTITSTATTQTPLTINGIVSQSANLQEWKNSSGAVIASVMASGNIRSNAFGSVAAGNAYMLTGSDTNSLLIDTNAAANKGLVVRGVASQSADLQQWQNSGGTVLAEIDSAGVLTTPRVISTQATGTAPFTVSSTTLVTNLNADLLDGQHASYYSPAGIVSQFAGSTAPTGWLLCDGSSKLVADYPALHAAIGYTYGGSGLNFNLPDLQGRVPVGPSGSTGRITTNNTLSATGGTEAVTLTAAQSGVPAHSHANTLSDPGHTHGQRGPVWRESGYNVTMRTDGGNGVSVDQGLQTSSSGTGITINNVNNTATNASQSHTNLQPYIVMNYIIKV